MSGLYSSLQTSLSGVAALLLIGSSATAQALRGTVLDSVNGQLVAGATVTVLDTTGTEVDRTITGTDGRFTLRLARAGTYRVGVRRIGFANAVTEPIRVSAGVETLLRLPILPTAVPLDTLTIRIEKVPVEQQIRWLADAGFHERRRKGLGYFLTRKDIDKSTPLVMSDVLHQIPGVRLVCTGRTCRTIMPGAMTMFIGGSCKPSIVLDGQILSVGGSGNGGSGAVDSLLNPFSIEAVEVYTSAASVPAQWGGYISPCGAIVAWSRR
jgi:hypothetical protein